MTKGKSDLQPTSKKHVSHVGLYMIPYIQEPKKIWFLKVHL
jgi:hypothetical protein